MMATTATSVAGGTQSAVSPNKGDKKVLEPAFLVTKPLAPIKV